MTNLIVFEIPGEPIAQGRPRATSAGGRVRMYDPAKSRRYKDLVKGTAAQYAPPEPLEGALGVELKIYRPIPASYSKKEKARCKEGKRRPVVKSDLDNYAKSILDAMNGLVYKDDSQVVDLKLSKHYSDFPRAEVMIWEVF